MIQQFVARSALIVAILFTAPSDASETFTPTQRVGLDSVGDTVAGIHFMGRDKNDFFGFAMAAGDFNGDGERDLVMSAEHGPSNVRKGETYLLYGPHNTTMNYLMRTDTQAVRFVGETGRFLGTTPIGATETAPGDRAGSSLEMFDLNGDGFDDIIIGSLAYDSATDDDCDISQCNLEVVCPCNPFNQSGRVYIIFGRPDVGGQKPFLDQGQDHFLADVGNSMPDSMVFKTTGAHHRFGKHLANAGDIDGDGVNDLVIGAQSYPLVGPPNASGAMYVIYGWCEGCNPMDARPTNPAPQGDDNASTFRLETHVLDGTLRGHMFQGTSNGGWMGACAGVGDMDGDGWGEMIMGEYKRDPNGNNQAGTVFLIYGGSDVPLFLDLSDLEDGTAPPAMRWAIFNGADTTHDDRPTPAPDDTFDHDPGDHAGFSVSKAGDVNGDGLADLLIAAKGAGPDVLQPYGCNNCGQPNEEVVSWTTSSNEGEVYLIYGTDGVRAPLTQGVYVLSDVGTSSLPGAIFVGEDLVDRAGDSIACAGDFNNDGLDDLIIGAVDADPGLPNNAIVFKAGNQFLVIDSQTVRIRSALKDDGAGKAYLVPGGPYLGTYNLEDVSVIFEGIGSADGGDSRDRAGDGVAGLGDLNGDGFDDIAIGSKLADSDRSKSGDAYIIYGRPVPFPDLP